MQDEMVSALLRIARHSKPGAGLHEIIKPMAFHEYVSLVGFAGNEEEGDTEWINTQQ